MTPRSLWRAVVSGSATLAVVLALAPSALPSATAASTTPQAQAASTDYQAEDATISQGVVESNHAGYTGSGFVNYDNLVGGYVEWTITAPAGPADVTLRYANGTTAARPLDFTVNGVAGAVGITFPGTGDWTTWQTKTVRLTLAAGTNKIRARATTADGGPNADKLTVTPTSDDTQPPSAPGNLAVSNIKSNAATFTWTAATDNVGVVRYEINRGGNVLKVVDANTLTATVDTLTSNTSYDVSVGAFDAAGNASQQSNVVTFTTPTSGDTQPPTAPGSFRSTSVSSNSVSLAWNASTDNSGSIAGYDVYQGSAKVSTTNSLTATITNLSPNTAYTFMVKARDPDGNASSPSNALTVRTASAGTGGIPQYEKDIARVDLGWSIAFLPDNSGSALVTERDRFEVLLVTAAGQKTTLGKVPGVVTTTGEGGLLGIALSPNFSTDHWVYLYHTAANDNRIVRMKYENGVLASTSEPILTGLAKNRYHNGGRLRFGPDGKLYATVGDAKNSANAQNKGSLNGKILRINPDGTPPSDNPFFSTGGNARYVYSYGHRNPQGLAWDSRGQLWAAEFGENSQDELNLIQKGGNYGWPACEGTIGDCGGYIAPKRTWSTSQAGPSGVEIVNDWIYIAGVTGQQLWVTQINSTGTGVGTPQAVFSGRWGRLRSVTKTPDGALWLTSTNNDMNGGSPGTIDNYIVRLKFPAP
ncbi:glucose/arabinose dehydrogenase [Kribbella voronezhensis]|uniref:Glucose/arabinose dehydrogenase n=1 Tax=Kribbella voronezhensis TaxID=2512212 RepID=A0A4R7T725_9ACTN|nr:PQQ-dependent sugar dehydrogenase [Kribbella voronezhensis]TDU87535.1 glucose/arabinose dehydrogenase [Kribbella voronezhensis]